MKSKPKSKPVKKPLKWKKVKGNTNEILSGKGFYLSYNPMASDFGLAELLDLLDPGAHHDRGGEETALFNKVTRVWYILNGDFKEEYTKAFPNGFKACLEVYNKHKPTNRSTWSTDDE